METTNISRERVKLITNILEDFNHGDIRKVADKYRDIRLAEGRNIGDRGSYSTVMKTIIKLKDGFHGNSTIIELLKEQAKYNQELITT